ncbi:hypothetical protein [Flavobacterium selenitireducens]|uniref:hypothetical protein n=1 Tax=Flavobacterium selenitireducens TaxID=2722704 RepID=UPI00168B4B91|nr:hypothetical protein [Flavobacterium selenitireducens]MBD3584038.1 hypothetical protein [Flavobacterium selenitireducens]
MDDETKKNWRKNWLLSINELTSIGLQQISWTNISLKSPHWTFVEFISSYFDDLALSENYHDEISRDLVSLDEYKIIENWHKSLSKYQPPKSDYSGHYSILIDPEWNKIVEFGKQSKIKLAEIVSFEEREILLSNLNIA